MTNTIDKLTEFINDYNDNLLPESGNSEEALTNYRNAVAESVVAADNGDDRALRLSSVGKVPLVQAFKLIGYREPPLGWGKLRHGTFHVGNEFEERLRYLLVRYGGHYGLSITASEVNVTYQGLTGHVDIVLNDDTIVEVKTMGSGPFFQASRVGINDDLGYATQLSTYSAGLGLPAVWVVEDKTTTSVKLIPLDEDYKADRLDRANDIISALVGFNEKVGTKTNEDLFHEAFALFEAPAPREYRGQLYLPNSTAWSGFKWVMYELEEDDNKLYYVDHREPADAWEVLQEELEDGYIQYVKRQT